MSMSYDVGTHISFKEEAPIVRPVESVQYEFDPGTHIYFVDFIENFKNMIIFAPSY